MIPQIAPSQHPQAVRSREYRRTHPGYNAKRSREYIARTGKAVIRERVIAKRLKPFRLTREQYEHELAMGCAICGDLGLGAKSLAFDHNHTTGQFRGMLCGKCNTALGLMDDDIERLAKAIEYLANRTK